MDDLLELLPENLNARDKVSFAQNLIEQRLQRANDSEAIKPNLKVEHHFSFGVYARILYIPADTILVGKIHKYPQINLLRQGCLSVLVGNKIKKLKAPMAIGSPAGTKRIAQVHIDTVWITIHRTHLTDIEQIENYFIAQDEKEYLDFRRKNETLLG